MRDRLKTRELWGIMLLLALHVFVLPLLMTAAQLFWHFDFGGLSSSQINLAYYGFGILLAFAVAGKYLRRSFDSLLDNAFGALKSFLLAWLIYYGLLMALALITAQIPFFDNNNPNQSAITDMAVENRGIIIAMTVFMAPVVEEVIFRGGVFCGLYHRSRGLAYVISIAAFSLYHVWQYALFGGPALLLFAVQYIPASFALCWCYEKSGSIWTSIFFHMSVNAQGIFLM